MEKQIILVTTNGIKEAFTDYMDAVASIESFVKNAFPNEYDDIMEEFNMELFVERPHCTIEFETITLFIKEEE